jgi:hypothetical protein
VLKEGVRIYGGFKGTEGYGTAPWGDTIDNLKDARAMRFKNDDTSGSPIEEKPLARKTVLHGSLRTAGSDYVHHVVIAAGIAPPAGDNPSSRGDLKTPAAYKFEPPENSDGVFGSSASVPLVTLLDTITIRNGMGEKSESNIKLNNGLEVLYRYGGGLYCVNASPYLRNVILGDNSAVLGGGMYNTAVSGGISAPVLKAVTFTNNNASGYKDEVGSGGGFTNAGGGTLCMPVFLNCDFNNNTTVGGLGAGLYMAGGKALVRDSEFYLNTASSAGGGMYNGAETWVYGGDIRNNQAFDGAYGISNSGSLYLVGAKVRNNINNSGTLSGTRLDAEGGMSSGGWLALTDSTLTWLSVSEGPTVLADVIFTGSGLSFNVSNTEKDEMSAPRLGGVILTKVNFRDGGISASYGNQYEFHHGVANLLLNSVLIDSGSLNIGNSGTAYPDGRSGVYVTMNNVTVKGSGQGLIINARGNAAVPVSAQDKTHDVLDLRIRNSLIMGNEDIPVNDGRPVIGTFAEAGDLTLGLLNFRREKAALLKPGDTFVVLKTDGMSRPALYTVYGVNASTGEVSFTPTPSGVSPPDFSCLTDETIVLSNWTSIGTIGSSVALSSGDTGSSLTLSSAQTALLPAGTVFKISDDPLAGASGTLLCQVSSADLAQNEITFDVLGTGTRTYTAGSHIMLSGKRPGLGPTGSKLKTETGENSWTLSAIDAALFEPGTTFRLSSGGTLTPLVNTVEGKTGNVISFTASSRDAYAAADKITLVSNGEIGAGGILSTDPYPDLSDPEKPNMRLLTNDQAAKLPVGTQFRLARSTGILRDSVNTVEAVLDADPGDPDLGKKLVFTAAQADATDADDIIMIVTGIPIGQSNLSPGGNLSEGILHIDPDLAALMTVDREFHIQKTDAGGTLSPVLTVSSVSGDKLVFTGGVGAYTRDDYIVFPEKYADLKGAVQWENSMARGAEKALGAAAFISGAGKTPGDVLEPDNAPKTPLIDGGNNALYPDTLSNDDAIADLLDQCFEQYEANGGNASSMRSGLESLFRNNLFTWDGTDLALPAGLGGTVGIAGFLAEDANGSGRINGSAIDVGANEKE